MALEKHIQDVVRQVEQQGFENVVKSIEDAREWSLETLKDVQRHVMNGVDSTEEKKNEAVLAVCRFIIASDQLLALVHHDLRVAQDHVERLKQGMIFQSVGFRVILEKLIASGAIAEEEFMKQWQEEFNKEVERISSL